MFFPEEIGNIKKKLTVFLYFDTCERTMHALSLSSEYVSVGAKTLGGQIFYLKRNNNSFYNYIYDSVGKIERKLGWAPKNNILNRSERKLGFSWYSFVISNEIRYQ